MDQLRSNIQIDPHFLMFLEVGELERLFHTVIDGNYRISVLNLMQINLNQGTKL